MRIVHYTIGLFPNRAGGLNRYATDLAKEQSKAHSVFILMPGSWRPFSKKCYISKGKEQEGLICYYLINALPQPLLYGIRRPNSMIGRAISMESFHDFYEAVRPDVLHLHTIMGMSEAALSFFKDKGVELVFTSHDYFGICPRVNLVNRKGDLCCGPSPERCCACNQGAPSTLFLRIRSSRLSFFLRDIIKWLKSIKRY